MIILDTDHINELQNTQGSLYQVLTARMSASADQDFATTVVTLEEQMRGWLALINRTSDVSGQVGSYERLDDVVTYFSRWIRLPFDNCRRGPLQTTPQSENPHRYDGPENRIHRAGGELHIAVGELAGLSASTEFGC